MVTLDKLIVVGMSKMPKVVQVKAGDSLYLMVESSTKGIEGKTLAVYKKGTEDHVGYIRNTDLEAIFHSNRGSYNLALSTQESYWYLVETVRVNYIVLKRIDIGTAKTNPCKEIELNGPIYCTLEAAEEVTKPKLNDKGQSMINTNSMRDQFFREVKNVAIDIQTGKFGISNTDGISVYDKGTINVNPIQELGVKIPAFAMRIAVDKLVAGDIIVNGNDAVFFVELNKEGGYKVMATSGEISSLGNVKNMFFGANTVLAVKNMFEGSGMNPMMMALMMGDGMMGDDKMDMKSLMLMSMMGGQGGEAMGGMNPMMLMLMMGDKFK
jgi:hypothetical protein